MNDEYPLNASKFTINIVYGYKMDELYIHIQ